MKSIISLILLLYATLYIEPFNKLFILFGVKNSFNSSFVKRMDVASQDTRLDMETLNLQLTDSAVRIPLIFNFMIYRNTKFNINSKYAIISKCNIEFN